MSVPQDFADAMMDVKKAIEDVRESKTLRQVLGSLLAIGNFLNGREVRGEVGMVCVVREWGSERLWSVGEGWI